MTTCSMGRMRIIAGLAVMALLLAAVPAWGASKASKQQEVQKMSRETLAKLYRVQPSAKKAVEGAAGYATFSNFGMKILFAGGGSGGGMAYDNKTKKTTYMKMVEVQAGLGMGIKKFRVVFVFDTQKALNDFVNSGWEFGGQTTAAAKAGDQGAALSGAISVAPGVWMYQLTETGLAAEITGKGTKYYKDSDLN
ncbi:MAG TPA: YSC84-related protein [Syntrophales bacterium]|nr:YSC84-related protein [Syntrophales bacterium]